MDGTCWKTRARPVRLEGSNIKPFRIGKNRPCPARAPPLSSATSSGGYVSADPFQPPQRIGLPLRIFYVALGLVLVGLLTTAAWLRPDPKGFGTHRQLGLGECTFMGFTGRPCPSCGMTTSWSNTLRGRWPTALRGNAGGTMLALASLLAAPWLIVSGVRGKWTWVRPHEYVLIGIALTIVAVTLAQWAWRMLSV